MRRNIEVRGARTHNLKGIDVTIPHRALTVVTGVSGSGKSSLAFDTLYAEGQMRYVESLSAYSRQFLEQMERPPLDSITGLPPAIALEQKNTVKNARSTVGTATEISDYLRLLYASVGQTICPHCNVRVVRHTVTGSVDEVLKLAPGSRLLVLAPVERGPSAESGQARPWESLRRELERLGLRRLWLAGRMAEVAQVAEADLPPEVEVIIDRLALADPPAESRSRLAESMESAFKTGRGRAAVVVLGGPVGEMPQPPAEMPPQPGEMPQQPGATPPLAPREYTGGRTDAGATPGEAAPLSPPVYSPGAKEGVASMPPAEAQRLAFDVRFNCAKCGREFPEPDAQLFSFNSAVGACPTCEGFGRVSGLDPAKIIPDPRKSVDNGAVTCWQTPAYKELHRECRRACHARGIRTDVPYVDLPESAKRFIWDGDHDSRGNGWIGIRGFFDWQETKRYKIHVRVMIARYRGYYPCPECGGKRLRAEALNVFVGGRCLADLVVMPVKDLRRWFDGLGLAPEDEEKAAVLLREIRNRLAYLDNVGLDYLTLDRQTRTLSGGESQRINLASALGSSLTNTLYVLDEPTVGLHTRDTQRLIGILRSLIGKGNTVVVVEHDPEVIEAAGHLIDLGPGAGEAGGRVVFAGSLADLGRCDASETARQMRTHADRAMAPYARRAKGWITLTGARQHNLKDLTVRIPLHVLCCVTGVSGSGKTTLVHSVLYGQFKHRRGEAVEEVGLCDNLQGDDEIDDLILVDQSPIGLSTRSNPVTYVKAYGAIRNLLAETPKARVAGITATDFSFNVTGGRCEVCKGVGTVTYDMYFMADVTVVCQECGGRRFKKKVLDVRWNGRNIDDILDMTVSEAMAHFAGHESITQHLQPLVDVGLGYLRLGQNTASLSGGEAQRLKLASYLAAPKKGEHWLFIFDEPTTGLHMADVQVLLRTFHRLVHAGHSLLVIEHNLDFISQADWIIDLGLEGGDAGGELIAAGPPDKVAACERSYTGRFLKRRLAGANS
ncbi:MAG: ATP-binding cassette domain-containing protein [Planctomycetes bacterium]|nr:ATP-binding cassette domain-containing protein [Planctomycetota bacterium]